MCGSGAGSEELSAEVCKTLNVPPDASYHTVITQEEPELSGLICLFVACSQMLFMCQTVVLLTNLMKKDNNTSV